MTWFPRAAAAAAALTLAAALTTTTTAAGGPPTEAEALSIGTEAYVFGYPLVTMEMTRRVMTNVAQPEAMKAPMGRFANARRYPDASFRDVTAPNADTLYSPAWLDLSKGPYVVTLPDEADRYFLMPMLSGWTDVFAVPGKRTTGTGPQTYAVTGPGWKGDLPAGIKELKSPTAMVWVLTRTYCTGTPEDYKAVHAIQDAYSLVPLNAYGRIYTPAAGKVDPTVDTKTPVREQVNRMDAAAYFKLLAALMKDNPPAEADAPVVARMAKVGIVPGRDFDAKALDPAVAKGLAAAPAAGLKAITAHMTVGVRRVNGWEYATTTGLYGTDYIERAMVTAFGLGANRPEDAVYPVAVADAAGAKLDGANRYVIRFPKGETPPVNGFWSITMYDAAYFFVPNPIDRSSVSPRNALKASADGSIDLYIQHDSPGPDRESNWLPAPAGPFVLMLRMYWPKAAVVDGTWTMPAVTRVE